VIRLTTRATSIAAISHDAFGFDAIGKLLLVENPNAPCFFAYRPRENRSMKLERLAVSVKFTEGGHTSRASSVSPKFLRSVRCFVFRQGNVRALKTSTDSPGARKTCRGRIPINGGQRGCTGAALVLIVRREFPRGRGNTGTAFPWSPAKLRIGNQVKFVERPIRPRGLSSRRKSASRLLVLLARVLRGWRARARVLAERFRAARGAWMGRGRV
jgi:hypothetical protein